LGNQELGFFARHNLRRIPVEGTLIRHAFSAQTEALPVKPLAIAVIESAFETPLVATIGLASLLSSCFQAASLTAVTVPSVTRAADVKRHPAPAEAPAQYEVGGHCVACPTGQRPPLVSG
jgi:hypothetical protein